MLGGVKFRIFTLTYKIQFWSYDNVVYIFLVCFEFKKHLITLSGPSEQNPRFLDGLKLTHGVKQLKQDSNRNFHMLRG